MSLGRRRSWSVVADCSSASHDTVMWRGLKMRARKCETGKWVTSDVGNSCTSRQFYSARLILTLMLFSQLFSSFLLFYTICNNRKMWLLQCIATCGRPTPRQSLSALIQSPIPSLKSINLSVFTAAFLYVRTSAGLYRAPYVYVRSQYTVAIPCVIVGWQ